ncbi:MAG: DUF177 domain-containing protein [Rhodospirillales bacterium]|nr:DUF177 domain-containing protein [Rhodospirillales bacterium]
MEKQDTPEFSRTVAVETVKEEAAFAIEATPAEREYLARRLGVVSVDLLTADLRLIRMMGAMVRLEGQLAAEVTQSCVVTLAPVHSRIAATVDRRYGPPEALAETDSEDVGLEDDDVPEVLVNGVIDLGEAVAEQLALEIDPFPRAEGAEFPGYASGPVPTETTKSPFAALGDLLKKQK